jgi:hypothetical protein
MKIRGRPTGVRLDAVLSDLRSEESSEATASDQVSSTILAVVDQGKENSRQSEDYIESMMIDFIMPLISDPGIFQNGRVVDLLEYLQANLLSELDNREELTELAKQIIEDEIARHNLVAQRRQSEIAA